MKSSAVTGTAIGMQAIPNPNQCVKPAGTGIARQAAYPTPNRSSVAVAEIAFRRADHGAAGKRIMDTASECILAPRVFSEVSWPRYRTARKTRAPTIRRPDLG